MRRIRAVVALAALAGAAAGIAPAGAQLLDEAEMKAAFVVNFVQFTNWPPGVLPDGTAAVVCVRSGSALAQRLGDVAGRKVPGRTFVLKPLPADARGCHVVVVDREDAAWLSAASRGLSQWPVLVVADDNDGQVTGSDIRLALSGRKIVFDVDGVSVRRAGLAVSSRVLQLARQIR